MSHPYTEYFTSKPTVEARLREHEKRIKALEAQLGAATSGVVPSTSEITAAEHHASCGEDKESGSGSAAAPSTYWSEQVGIIAAVSDAPVLNGRLQIGVTPEKLDELIRLHRFAAAIVRWYERADNRLGELDTVEGLYNIACAFARGEKLPEVK